MFDDVALLCDRLTTSGSPEGPAEVASISREHGLSIVQTTRLVLQVCGVSFSAAVAAAVRAHHDLPLEEDHARFSGRPGR